MLPLSSARFLTTTASYYAIRSLRTAIFASNTLNYCVGLEESDYTQVLYVDHLPCAQPTFQALESILGGDPREPRGDRFVWDPWVVKCGQGKNGQEAPLPGDFDDWEPIPGERDTASKQIQYSMTRAQCSDIFDDDTFEQLIDGITELGRSIGCSGTTPPWISLYGSDQMQNFHMDAAQGSMAWTLSLSKGYGSTFTGGETVLLTPKVLDYWRDFDASRGREAPTLMRFLPPLFGRFVAFDGRVPHMVQRVSANGCSPLEARITIHGWFADPQVIWLKGKDLEESEVADATLNESLESITDTLKSSDLGRIVGFLSVRLDISPDGEVEDLNAVCDTLRNDPADYRGVIGYDPEGREIMEDASADAKVTIQEALGKLIFPETKEGGSVVVPFDFV